MMIRTCVMHQATPSPNVTPNSIAAFQIASAVIPVPDEAAPVGAVAVVAVVAAVAVTVALLSSTPWQWLVLRDEHA